MKDKFEFIFGRKKSLFHDDMLNYDDYLSEKVKKSKFLVLGGAGTIGQAVVEEIFARNPNTLHVVDINENNLVECVRKIRSSWGYIDGNFQTFCLDCGDLEFDKFLQSVDGYDYVLNLSAMKHVRSERDPYTLMRMIKTNFINTAKVADQLSKKTLSNFFCVSTDKAANPVNLMGASKRLMELWLLENSLKIHSTSARFANVAFSDGSLLHGFEKRMELYQPLSAPSDVKRYFISPKEAGELCLFSCIMADNNEVLFPKLDFLSLVSFKSITEKYLEYRGYRPLVRHSEEEARFKPHVQIENGYWPCYFFKSNTSGEKPFEEFYTTDEKLNIERYKSIGIIKPSKIDQDLTFSDLVDELENLQRSKVWKVDDLVNLVGKYVPEFNHMNTGLTLDGRM